MTRKRIDMQTAAAYWAKVTGTPRPHRGTLIRWASKGVRGVRLQAEPIAGRWYTTTDAVDEFLRHMPRPGDVGSDVTAVTVRATQVGMAIEDLDQMLDRKPAKRHRSAK
jgi:hypothetical protein